MGTDELEKIPAILKDIESFYYVVHPVDLMSVEDIDSTKRMGLVRIQQDLSFKEKIFERSIEKIIKSERTLVTMQELAHKVRGRRMETTE